MLFAFSRPLSGQVAFAILGANDSFTTWCSRTRHVLQGRRRPGVQRQVFPEEHAMPVHRAGFQLPFQFPAPLEELREEFDRLWNSLSAAPPLHGWGARATEGLFPAVNVRETDAAFVIEAELPGLDAADVDISASGTEVVLKGSRPEATAEVRAGNGEQQPATWHRRERGTGGFERRLTLPTAIDAGGVEAALVNGVLTVTCPKAPECRPRKIDVRAG
jgi:HSP20 family protein